ARGRERAPLLRFMVDGRFSTAGVRLDSRAGPRQNSRAGEYRVVSLPPLAPAIAGSALLLLRGLDDGPLRPALSLQPQPDVTALDGNAARRNLARGNQGLHLAQRHSPGSHTGFSDPLFHPGADQTPARARRRHAAPDGASQPMAPGDSRSPPDGHHHVADLENQGSNPRQRVRARTLMREDHFTSRYQLSRCLGSYPRS